jgi:hypothetical protein
VRVGLLKYREFHDPILRPVRDALVPAGHQCLLTSDEEELVAFRPQVVVMGEAVAGRLRQRMPYALFVHTRHGLASKNVAYKGCNEADYLCVTSPFVRDWYVQHKARPRRDFWVVGYLQMDPLFRGDPMPVNVPVRPGHKTVLYAPTWNVQLSSAEIIGPRGIDLIRGGGRDDFDLVIKPHPLIAIKQPEWMDWWRQWAAEDPHVHLVADADADVMPFLKLADVLLTDASSVALEYLAVDRPLVLVNNPRRFGCKDFDPAGFEWAWRDMGEEVFDPEELTGAMNRALDDPGARSEYRARYRKLMFGDLTDGRTAERIRDRVGELKSVLPRVAAAYVAGWPLRRARGVKRRIDRLLNGGPSSSPVQPTVPGRDGRPSAADPRRPEPDGSRAAGPSSSSTSSSASDGAAAAGVAGAPGQAHEVAGGSKVSVS